MKIVFNELKPIDQRFRGFSIIEKKYVYGYLFVAEDIKGNRQAQILVPDYFVGNSKCFVVDETTVDMAIGVKDINGQEIYTRDSIKCTIPGIVPVQQIGQVAFVQGNVLFMNEKINILLSSVEQIEIISDKGKDERKVNI